MKVMFIGDVVGKVGRRAVREALPHLRKVYAPDLIIANAENAAGGNGITPAVATELFASGLDFLTMGNHVWDKREAIPLLDAESCIIRPANYPPGTPGQGWAIINTRRGVPVGVINLSGRVFMADLGCPFRHAEDIIENIITRTRVIIVDFHAEATSEKMAFGWYLAGKVSMVVGTHTHVQTADERILKEHTAYLTDVGMTGPLDSVLGVDKDLVIKKFVTQMPVKFEQAHGSAQLNAVVVDILEETGKATRILRLQEHFSEPQ